MSCSPLNILHIADKNVPATGSQGGMPQSVTWLAQEQSKAHNVAVMSPTGQKTEYFYGIALPESVDKIVASIPCLTDIVHLHYLNHDLQATLVDKGIPFVTHVRGNISDSTRYINSIYVSKSHARNHGGSVFVYNGLPIGDYPLFEKKSDYFLFLGKVKRSNKGIQDAIKFSKLTSSKLFVAGGYRLGSIETWLPVNRKIKSVGVVFGQEKLDLIANARAVIFPIKWEEPFGLVMIEAMATGTPVLAYNRGSVPEVVVDGKTGFVCDSLNDLCLKSDRLDEINAFDCRAHVENWFDIKRTAQECNELYKKAIAGITW